MTFLLKSVDRKEVFEVPEWFYDADHEVHRSVNKWLYMQGPQKNTSDRQVDISFKVVYKSDPPQITSKIIYDIQNPTWCNFNTATFLSFFGRHDLAGKVFFGRTNANSLVRILRNGAGRKLALPPDKITNDKCIIATFENTRRDKAGKVLPGHVSPYIGCGKDGHFYCDNIGAFFRHDIRRVDGKNSESAFWEELKDIEFYEIDRIAS